MHVVEPVFVGVFVSVPLELAGDAERDFGRF
jgi:hypothetical protein